MTYLVTGGAGFIGGHVARALLARGERVVAIDNFNDYYDPAIKRHNAARLCEYDNFRMIEGDIRDVDLVDRLFAERGITHVAHLAAMAGVRESVRQPRLYLDVNLTGSLNLLEAAKAADIEQFVLASTSSVYGRDQGSALCRDGQRRPPLGRLPG